MPTKVALFLPSLAGGGAERVLVHLGRGFAERGVQVDLVLAQARGEYLDAVDSNVKIVDLGAERVLQALPGLRRYLVAERPVALLSALEHTNVVAIWAKCLARVPVRVVVGIHNTMSSPLASSSATFRHRLTPLLARLFYPLSDAVVAVSEGAADDFSRVSGFPRRRIQVIYNPVAIDEITAKADEPLDHPWFAPGEPPVVLGVGRLTEQKDFSTLLRAFSLLQKTHSARLVILGEGEERPRLQSLARDLGIQDKVLFPGFVENPYKYMKRAAVFALSSRWEGFGLVLVEAMAVGTPVVSTDAPGGPREILQDGKWGRLVPVGDAHALARALAEVLANPRRGEAVQRAMDFSLDAIVERYAHVLHLPIRGSANGS